jgi:RsmE family RNA methyltransferase
MNLILLFESDFIDSSREKVQLRGRRKEHIQTVCKSSVGEKLRAGIFGGLTGTALITKIDDVLIEMDVSLTDQPPPPLPLTLILALPRPKSLKKSIEVATSLGVKKIFIIESWRVEKSYWTSPVLTDENINNQIVLGLEQARDTIPPLVVIKRRFKPFVEDELPLIISGSRALVAHPYVYAACPYAVSTPVTLVVGPEGGFIPYEIELLEKNGFEAVSLGQRILRVENAIAVLAGRLFV